MQATYNLALAPAVQAFPHHACQRVNCKGQGHVFRQSIQDPRWVQVSSYTQQASQHPKLSAPCAPACRQQGPSGHAPCQASSTPVSFRCAAAHSEQDSRRSLVLLAHHAGKQGCDQGPRGQGTAGLCYTLSASVSLKLVLGTCPGCEGDMHCSVALNWLPEGVGPENLQAQSHCLRPGCACQEALGVNVHGHLTTAGAEHSA